MQLDISEMALQPSMLYVSTKRLQYAWLFLQRALRTLTCYTTSVSNYFEIFFAMLNFLKMRHLHSLKEQHGTENRSIYRGKVYS